MVGMEELNREIRSCRGCRLAETRTNALCGEGNLRARLMLVAQAPGENEDREGKMFIGPSGRVLNELLKEAGIAREEVYMTNLVKCKLPGYRRPKPDEIQACSRYLDREIELVNPAVIVPLGYYATRYIFEKYGLYLPAKSEFHQVYGRLLLGERKVFPLQHPAALLYDESAREKLVKNYLKLKVLSRDCKWYSVCPMKWFYESGRLGRRWIELYCKGDWESCTRYQMEEKGEPHPDWMLPDGSLDESLSNP